MPDIVELIKLAVRPRYSFAIWVVGLIVIFFPGFLKLSYLDQDYADWVKIVTFFAFVVWNVEMAVMLKPSVQQAWQQRQTLAQLDSLSRQELWVLAKALSVNASSFNWRLENWEVSALIQKGLLVPVAHKDQLNIFGVYEIPRFVWKRLKKNDAQFVERTNALWKDKKTALELRGDGQPSPE